MQILTIDIGTGTQDIFLYDSNLDIENGFKMIMPSPTMMVFNHIHRATEQKHAVVLTGILMGGGPNAWASEAHLRAGLPVYATPQAALSFNDDLNKVKEMGITLVSDDEASKLPEDVERIELRDFDFSAIARAFGRFGVSLNNLSAVAVAVFDHGNAPQNISDRQFRFDYLDERIRQHNRLSAFAFLSGDIPPIMTRLQAVAQSASDLNAPIIVMDTAPAAVLGATFDPRVCQRRQVMIANIGNFHTLAFRLGESGIEGVFEHHTGLLDREKLEQLLYSLADGSLSHADVFDHHGHGALIYQSQPLNMPGDDFGVVATGPRRSLISGSALKPYYSAPFGDMMISGCFGLLAAAADLLPQHREVICQSLTNKSGSGVAPWDARSVS